MNATDLNTQLRDNMLWLGGTTGRVTQTAYNTFVGAISTASASYVTTTDSISMTTTGGDVLVFVSAGFVNSAVGQTCGLAVQQDAGGYTEVSAASSPVIAYAFTVAGLIRFSAPSAASHTYNTGWRNLTGAGTLTQGPGPRIILAVELKR